MVSLFEVFYIFFINFHTLNSKIISRFIYHVKFFNEVKFLLSQMWLRFHKKSVHAE
jgi:hypothetical protein